MARMFIALWPDDAVRHSLAAWRDAWHWPRAAAPVRSERLHMTLHFIGDVERELLPELAAALRLPFERFELKFSRAQLWPNGVAVLEPDAAPAPLLALHAELAIRLRQLALPVDSRPFRPHVTLARRAGRSEPPLSGPSIDWKINCYALMESTLGPDGGYTTVCEFRS